MKKTIALLFGLTIATVMNAQDFSGHYALQSKEVIKGKEYLNAIALEITITQTNDSIKIVRIIPAAGGQTTSSKETLPINGKQIISTTSSNRQNISSVSFNKKTSTATIFTTFSYPGKPAETEFKNTEIWAISNNNTLMITKTSDATLTDDWTIKAVFKKQ